LTELIVGMLVQVIGRV